MTTFTTDDKEEAYKKMLEEAPAHIGYEDAVEPIPFAGWVNLSPLKQLTDDEITAISKEIFKDYKNFHHYQIDFARAILRKAQEK